MDEDQTLSPLFFEYLLVGLLFTDKEVREKIYPFLVPDIFDGFETKEIIQKILHFVEENDKFPTVPEMKLEIHDKKVFETLQNCMNIDVSEYDRDYLLSKVEDFFKRKMILNELAAAASVLKEEDLGNLSDTPDKIREKIAFSFNTSVGVDIFSNEGEKHLYDYLHNEEVVVPTGIPYFDKMIEGGFHTQSLSLFLAETNKGKSLIMCSLATNSLLQNKNVLYISLEMSKEKITQRILANIFDKNISSLKHLTRENFSRQYNNIRNKLKGRMIVDDFPPKTFNSNHLRNFLKELKVKKSFIPDILFLDYMGLMSPINNKNSDNSYAEQKRISEELRAVGVEYEFPIVSGAQTNRGGFSSAIIDLTDISESIGVPATADLIVGVTQTDEYREAGKYCWIVLKNRYGINQLKVNVAVDYPKMRIFSDPDREETTPPESTKIIDDAVVDILTKKKDQNKKKLKDLSGIEM